MGLTSMPPMDELLQSQKSEPSDHKINFSQRLLCSVSTVSVSATAFIHLILALHGSQLYMIKLTLIDNAEV